MITDIFAPDLLYVSLSLSERFCICLSLVPMEEYRGIRENLEDFGD